MIELASSMDPQLLNLLNGHPRVSHAVVGDELLQFSRDRKWRNITVGSTVADLFGLVELIDNNPLVCADTVSVPNPSQTLALIALGPIADAGLIAETPRIIANLQLDAVREALQRVGLDTTIDYRFEPMDLGSVLVMTVMVEVLTPADPMEIGEIYEERFGRSFFVRRDESSSWSQQLVQNQPHAVYRVSIAEDRPNSLVTIRVMADRHGKCGAAQCIHAMNVMCGYEESLGLSSRMP